MGKVSYMPTDGLCYDPNDPLYWNREALDKEVKRAYEVCNGCRMCFKYCDTFPDLFKLLDDRHDGDVNKVNAEETKKIMDSCFQCKLCEIQCPYTPRDNHEFQLDFPKLVHRYQAQEHKNFGSDLRDKLLGDPDSSAKMARASFGMANKMNKVKLHRWFLEKLVGIHKDKQLPDFSNLSFTDWAEKSDKIKDPSPQVEAVLFPTCYIEHNEPKIGKDTVEVMEKNSVNLACSKGLNCCGMPAWEHGDIEKLREHAENNINRLLPYVENGAKVFAINPTCSMMLKDEYPELVHDYLKEKAKKISEAVLDPAAYLWNIRKEDRAAKAKSKPGEKIAYHAPCHLRVQASGFKARDLIRSIGKVKVGSTLECCGHNGTYAMKEEYFESSIKIGKKAFDSMKEADAEVWVTDCPLAAIQFDQHAGVRPIHPMSYLAKAYDENGFPIKIKEEDED